MSTQEIEANSSLLIIAGSETSKSSHLGFLANKSHTNTILQSCDLSLGDNIQLTQEPRNSHQTPNPHPYHFRHFRRHQHSCLGSNDISNFHHRRRTPYLSSSSHRSPPPHNLRRKHNLRSLRTSKHRRLGPQSGRLYERKKLQECS